MRAPGLLLAYALISACCLTLCAACSSRPMPKPRPEAPPSTEGPGGEAGAVPTLPPDNVAITTPRPNITFPTFKCPPTYAAWYCLNDATCFTVEIHNDILYNCECALGFMGPRCEYKEIDGSYLPTRNRVMLEKASIVSGATLALLFMAMCCVILYMRHEKQQKQKLNDSGTDVGDVVGGGGGGCQNDGMDEVDGRKPMRSARRPFAPCRILSLEEAHYQALVSNHRPRHCN
ncbi:protein spitz [Drosophila obscura]|uniref:protein spitz n=1 Tax=Drosophila obscura TaxID=7282 RepID=UPI001BB15A08|nr:protein spitz [Drosophila obscura]XP_041448838.1 protein spitz [Drosophila obscura]